MPAKSPRVPRNKRSGDIRFYSLYEPPPAFAYIRYGSLTTYAAACGVFWMGVVPNHDHDALKTMTAW